MKKLVSIFLLSLYLVSFSGMVWASDCKAQQTYSHSSTDFTVPCNKNTGHAANTHSHPLQQFCKLIEVHKEVLVSNHQQVHACAPSTPVITNAFRFRHFARQQKIEPEPVINSSHKLFIQHCVLII